MGQGGNVGIDNGRETPVSVRKNATGSACSSTLNRRPRQMFQEILRLIADLRPQPLTAPA